MHLQKEFNFSVQIRFLVLGFSVSVGISHCRGDHQESPAFQSPIAKKWASLCFYNSGNCDKETVLF